MMIAEGEQKTTLKSWWFTIASCLLFVGIIAGEKAQALLSIGMAAQLLSVLLFTSPKQIWTNFIGNKAMLLFSLCYLFLLLSFFYSDNKHYLLERLQIKIPLLLYALFWPSLVNISTKQLRIIFYAFIGVIVISALGMLTNYALHFDEVNQLYLQSKLMPGPINHIRFSLLVVFAIYFIYYYQKHILRFNKCKELNLLIACAIFLIVFLHIYSVRSGLLALYAVIAIALFNHTIASKSIKQLLIVFGGISLIAVTSIMISPTMRNKIINTQQDVNVYQNCEDPNFNSLATRMVSYKTALIIYNENKLWGCGQGDLRDKNDALFKRDYPSIVTPIIPHNQFIYYLAATGIIGLLIFSIAFTAPLWVDKFYRWEFMQVGYAILLLAFQFEPMIETQIGVACTIVMIFIPYYFTQQRKLSLMV